MHGKYDTDNYNVTTFDRRGARLKKHPLGNVGLTQSIAFGRDQISKAEAKSFVVERVLYNSLDQVERWLPKPTGRFADGKPYEQEE